MSSLQDSGRQKASAAAMFLGPVFPVLTTSRKQGTSLVEQLYGEALDGCSKC